ncbi:unnamed protein product [Cladocopium goreaui]|uniref:LINE-1 retrotransposable element ORF2 protein n=1 Tax=Cladocopium goreaui TaxID=2562237 RepID=A0A9P1DW76_9DINO|nr:unnamed protein product [Cladocopium goreaui]
MAFSFGAHLLSWFILPLAALDFSRFYWREDASYRSCYFCRQFGLLLLTLSSSGISLFLVKGRWLRLSEDSEMVWDDGVANAAALGLQVSVLLAQYSFWSLLIWLLSFTGVLQMARSLVLSSSPSSSAEIFGHKLRLVLQILAILGVSFAVEGAMDFSDLLAVQMENLSARARVSLAWSGTDDGWTPSRWNVFWIPHDVRFQQGIEEIDTGIKSNCEIHSDDGNALQIMAQSLNVRSSCLSWCRKTDLFLPTWPRSNSYCNEVISWKIFESTATESCTDQLYTAPVVYVLFVWLVAFQQHCCCRAPRSSSPSEDVLLSARTMEPGSRERRAEPTTWPDVQCFRADGPYQGELRFVDYLCKSMSASDLEAARKGMLLSMLGTASELIFSLAASWCLLADGLPFYGSLILVSIFVPCLNFYFKLTMGFFGTLERGFTNAEVWRCQWAQGLFQGVSTLFVSISVLGSRSSPLSACTMVNLVMCSFLSALVSVPNTSLAASLLSDPLLDQNDFYDIHAAVRQQGIRKYRRSLVVFLCCFLVHGIESSRHHQDLLLWLQFLIFALAVALELSLVLNELVAVLIGWRGFHLGRRNVLSFSTLMAVPSFLTTEVATFAERFCFLLLIAVMCWDGDQDPMIIGISSCSLLLLHLLDHCYAPVSWPEPIEKEGVYTIRADGLPVSHYAFEEDVLQEDVGVLKAGSRHTVVEVKDVVDDCVTYVRGRLTTPAGWITLRRRNTVSIRWAHLWAARDWHSLMTRLGAAKLYYFGDHVYAIRDLDLLVKELRDIKAAARDAA